MDKPGRVSRFYRGSSKFKFGYRCGIVVVMAVLLSDVALAADKNQKLLDEAKGVIAKNKEWLKANDAEIGVSTDVKIFETLQNEVKALEAAHVAYSNAATDESEAALKKLIPQLKGVRARAKVVAEKLKKADAVLQTAKDYADDKDVDAKLRTAVKAKISPFENIIKAYKTDWSANEVKLQQARDELDGMLPFSFKTAARTGYDKIKKQFKRKYGYGIIGSLFAAGGWVGGSFFPIPNVKPDPKPIDSSSSAKLVNGSESTERSKDESGGFPWEIVVVVVIVIAVIIGIGSFYYYYREQSNKSGTSADRSEKGSSKATSSTGGSSTGAAATSGTSSSSKAGGKDQKPST